MNKNCRGEEKLTNQFYLIFLNDFFVILLVQLHFPFGVLQIHIVGQVKYCTNIRKTESKSIRSACMTDKEIILLHSLSLLASDINITTTEFI